MIESHKETIDGIAYRITFDVEDFEGIQAYPATVWREDDAGVWRIVWYEDGEVTKEDTIAACLHHITTHNLREFGK